MAERCLFRVGLSTDELPNPVELAERLLGPGAVLWAEEGHQPPRLAALIEVDGRRHILLRRVHHRNSWTWGVFHELGHWLALCEGLDWEDEELANTLGAMLRVPRPVASRAIEEAGDDFAHLSSLVDTSQSSAALRYGEVAWEPLAVVGPRSVRIRGPKYWPEDMEQVRKLAQQPHPGIRAVRLTDAPNRWVLLED